MNTIQSSSPVLAASAPVVSGALELYFIRANTQGDSDNDNIDLHVWAIDAEQAKTLWRAYYKDWSDVPEQPSSATKVPVLNQPGAVGWDFLT